MDTLSNTSIDTITDLVPIERKDAVNSSFSSCTSNNSDSSGTLLLKRRRAFGIHPLCAKRLPFVAPLARFGTYIDITETLETITPTTVVSQASQALEEQQPAFTSTSSSITSTTRELTMTQNSYAINTTTIATIDGTARSSSCNSDTTTVDAHVAIPSDAYGNRKRSHVGKGCAVIQTATSDVKHSEALHKLQQQQIQCLKRMREKCREVYVRPPKRVSTLFDDEEEFSDHNLAEE